jgi:hypothetical protein
MINQRRSQFRRTFRKQIIPMHPHLPGHTVPDLYLRGDSTLTLADVQQIRKQWHHPCKVQLSHSWVANAYSCRARLTLADAQQLVSTALDIGIGGDLESPQKFHRGRLPLFVFIYLQIFRHIS